MKVNGWKFCGDGTYADRNASTVTLARSVSNSQRSSQARRCPSGLEFSEFGFSVLSALIPCTCLFVISDLGMTLCVAFKGRRYQAVVAPREPISISIRTFLSLHRDPFRHDSFRHTQNG